MKHSRSLKTVGTIAIVGSVAALAIIGLNMNYST